MSGGMDGVVALKMARAVNMGRGGSSSMGQRRRPRGEAQADGTRDGDGRAQLDGVGECVVGMGRGMVRVGWKDGESGRQLLLLLLMLLLMLLLLLVVVLLLMMMMLMLLRERGRKRVGDGRRRHRGR